MKFNSINLNINNIIEHYLKERRRERKASGCFHCTCSSVYPSLFWFDEILVTQLHVVFA